MEPLWPLYPQWFIYLEVQTISAATGTFKAYPSRTSLKKVPVKRYDYIMFRVIVGLVVLDVVANVIGFERSVPYVGL